MALTYRIVALLSMQMSNYKYFEQLQNNTNSSLFSSKKGNFDA